MDAANRTKNHERRFVKNNHEFHRRTFRAKIRQRDGSGGGKTLVESACGASQHLNYYKYCNTMKSLSYLSAGLLLSTLVAVIRWSPPAGNSKCFAAAAAIPLPACYAIRRVKLVLYKGYID
jgi:hypothetical protein